MGGCINGVHSSGYIARSGIGLLFSDMVERPASYTRDMIPLGLCIIKNLSYKRGEDYFFAESICGEASGEGCIVYNQVNGLGVVKNAWVDKGLSKLWQEEIMGNRSLRLRCDKKILNRQDMDWRTWITNASSSGANQAKWLIYSGLTANTPALLVLTINTND